MKLPPIFFDRLYENPSYAFDTPSPAGVAPNWFGSSFAGSQPALNTSPIYLTGASPPGPSAITREGPFYIQLDHLNQPHFLSGLTTTPAESNRLLSIYEEYSTIPFHSLNTLVPHPVVQPDAGWFPNTSVLLGPPFAENNNWNRPKRSLTEEENLVTHIEQSKEDGSQHNTDLWEASSPICVKMGDNTWVCTINSCGSRFGKYQELARHQNSLHFQRRRYPCRIPGCLRSRRGFPRKDKRDDHEKKVHGTQVVSNHGPSLAHVPA